MTSHADIPRSGLNFLWLEITEKCNLTCVHCYADSHPTKPLLGAMGRADWMRVLDEAAELGCRRVQFIGGEPTLHPDLPDLIEQARRLGFEDIEVYTNGIHFKPRLKDVFVHERVALAFSVYATDPEVHDLVTQRAGSFVRTIDSIKWALGRGLEVRAGVIETDVNAGQGDATRELLEQMGVGHVGIDRRRGIGRGAAKTKTRDVQLGELCGQCWQGKLCVTPSGNAFPCVFSRFCTVGSVAIGLSSLLGRRELLDFQDEVRELQEVRERSAQSCEPFSPPVCQPKRPWCTPDAKCNPEQEVRLTDATADCEPFSPPVCKPNRTVCNPDLPCSPDTACKPNTPCNPDCVPSACTPQIAKTERAAPPTSSPGMEAGGATGD